MTRRSPSGSARSSSRATRPGNGNAFVAVRNEDYWRGDGRTASRARACRTSTRSRSWSPSTSTAAPARCAPASSTSSTRRTLDEIAAVPRRRRLRVARQRHVRRDRLPDAERRRGRPTPTPASRSTRTGANADSPLLHLSCRKALAHAIDYERYNEERNAGLATIANGPFPPGSIGYLEDTGYPTFDRGRARRPSSRRACRRRRRTRSR